MRNRNREAVRLIRREGWEPREVRAWLGISGETLRRVLDLSDRTKHIPPDPVVKVDLRPYFRSHA